MSDENKMAETGSAEFRLAEIKKVANKLMDEKFKGWKKALVFFGIVFLLVLAAIVAIGVLYISDLAKTMSDIANAAGVAQNSTVTVERNGLLSADYLAAVIPLLLALGGSFIAFLGMNRLKMFDDRIDQTRAEMLKEIESKVKSEIAVDRTAFFNQIIEEINGEQKKIDDIVRNSETELTNRKQECIQGIEDKFGEFDRKYEWLKATVTTETIELNFYTVDDAHRLVEQLRHKKPSGYVDIIRKIVDRVCNITELSGDAADYHNLSAEIARGSMYIEACKVLKKGLSFFKCDIDLLSDLVEYATKGSMFDFAQDAVEQLAAIDQRLWNWRCYEFTCDYYRSVGKLEDADTLCDEFIHAIPNDEHGYHSKAEIATLLYPGMDGVEKSIGILESAISANVNCPQCANTLAETYLSIGRYKDALRAANRAILELAQEQPHVEISYVFYNRAATQDRMFMIELSEDVSNHSLADAAYKDYSMALGFGKLTPIVKLQAQIRMKILESYVSPDLVESNNSGGDSNRLLDLLQALKSDDDNSDD